MRTIDKLSLSKPIAIFFWIGYLPGHGNVLHSSDCFEGPRQFFPPFAGAGLSHFLILCFTPPPQLFVHCPKMLHGDQLPSTKIKKKLLVATFAK